MKLIIVESPTKAKTITKFLGDDYIVLSSYGHVRDLPKSKMGVDTAHDFTPVYVVPKKAEDAVYELKRALKNADGVILATDEDREGEAIAWHLAETLGLGESKGKKAKNKITDVSRIVFHEITRDAIHKALEHPRTVDMRLVNAQQARRIMDRLVGYELSPLLWAKVQRGLSAGRVQSVAVRLVVERERERDAFAIEEYWSIDASFEKDTVAFPGNLIAINGAKVGKLGIKTKEAAVAIVDAVIGAPCHVTATTTKDVKKFPLPPFTTSSLQIDANTKLGMSAKQTMTLAQKLYETGRITYMRTDSFNLAQKFLDDAQAYAKKTFGAEYATGAKTYKSKAKGAQEAHEAIRPTDVRVTPDDLPKNADAGTVRLYELIWRRAVASQLPPAQLTRTSVDIDANKHTFRATGSIVVFDGCLRVYQGMKEKLLPALKEGDAVTATSITPTQHFTEPPARYSDATLVKTLEEHGIGRPSTYAPTISTVIARGYVDRDANKKLAPTDIGKIVNDVLVAHFPNIVDYAFTAKMESELDDIADGKREWQPTLAAFYKPFHDTIDAKSKELKREDIMKERLIGTDPTTALPVIARNGRFGAFVQLGEWAEKDKKKKINKPKSASLEKGQSMDTLSLEDALRLLILPRDVGAYTNGEHIIADKGRFGPYLRAGDVTASLEETEDPRTITLPHAVELLTASAEKKKKYATPIAELGEDPVSKTVIQVRHGRYGPYVTDGTTHATIPKKQEPETVTHEEAVDLLEKKRKRGSRNFGKKRFPQKRE